ncbi:hypothetical protein KSS87_005713 [Heliosperma pusillum]|nr:hypothetical protein KSS87_005713 [Heliosperma pusillum]
MESEKIHHHYAHTDASKHLRWTARECYEYMYAKPWSLVNAFYFALVNAHVSLSELFGAKIEGDVLKAAYEYAPDITLPEDQLGRWARVTYKIVLSYHGAYFDGWQKQPGLNTVQGYIEGGNVGEKAFVIVDSLEKRAEKRGREINCCGVLIWRNENDVGVKEVGLVGRAAVEGRYHDNVDGGWGSWWWKCVGLVGMGGMGRVYEVELSHVGGDKKLVERAVGTFVDDKKAQQQKAKGLPVDGMVVVAGRTDKGVTGLNQVCSFYTWRKDVKVEEIERAIDAAAPAQLRVVTISQVSRAFHPNFCAKWRRYLYIFPIGEGVGREENIVGKMETYKCETMEDSRDQKTDGSPNGNDCDGIKKPTCFSIAKVDQLLRCLEGKLLSYKMFARDTKASRNTFEAIPVSHKLLKACDVESLPLISTSTPSMIRVLVATVVREAAAGSEDDVLVQLTEATCRRATAPPAPPDGLCFVDVGYSDFDPRICFIH